MNDQKLEPEAEPEDTISKLEKHITFRTLLFGGKLGGAFAGISAGALAIAGVVGWLLNFSSTPAARYVVPVAVVVVCISAFVVHFWKSPILAAPYFMFGFLLMAGLWFYIGVAYCVHAAIGEQLIVNNQFGDFMLGLHGAKFKNLKTQAELDAHIAKNKKSIHEDDIELARVGTFYLVNVGLYIITAIYGFFSRLWLMENSIIDTQLRLILLCDRCLKLASNATENVKTFSSCVDESKKSKMTAVKKKTAEIETELAQVKNEMNDLPSVGFRRGKLLFFKGKPSPINSTPKSTRSKKLVQE